MENLTHAEVLFLFGISFLLPIPFVFLAKFISKKINKKNLKIEDSLFIYPLLAMIFGSFFTIVGPQFFETEQRLQEVQDAKREVIAKKLDVSQKEIHLQEKDYRVKKDMKTHRAYEVKTKDQSFEVAIEHEAFKQYRVIKVWKTLEEENVFTH